MPIHFACGTCGKTFTVPDDQAGKKGKCTKCGAPSIVPIPPVAIIKAKAGAWLGRVAARIPTPPSVATPVLSPPPKPIVQVAPAPSAKPEPKPNRPYANPLRSGMSAISAHFTLSSVVARVMMVAWAVLGLLFIGLIAMVLIFFMIKMARVIFA